MISLLELQNQTSNVTSLENYLAANFEKVYDFFELQKHSDLLKSKEELRRYVSLNWQVLNQLNKTNSTITLFSYCCSAETMLSFSNSLKCLIAFSLSKTA